MKREKACSGIGVAGTIGAYGREEPPMTDSEVIAKVREQVRR